MIDEKKTTKTFQDQLSEDQRLKRSGQGHLDYLNEPKTANNEIKEKLLENPIIKQEFIKLYYDKAETQIGSIYSYPILRKKRRILALYITFAVIFALIESILASIGPHHFSFGLIFIILFSLISGYLLYCLYKSKAVLENEEIKRYSPYKVLKDKFGNVELSNHRKEIYWIYLVSLFCGSLIDILNVGLSLDSMNTICFILQIFALCISVIFIVLYSFALKEYYAGYVLIIADGEPNEGVQMHKTIYHQEEEKLYRYQDFLFEHNDLDFDE